MNNTAMNAPVNTSLNYSILITAPPYGRQGAHSAQRFCQAVLAQAHKISSIFFYSEGVQNANRLITCASDEVNLIQAWQNLAQLHGTQLLVCVDAAERRSVVQENLAAGFKLTGLAELIEAANRCDRFITFN